MISISVKAAGAVIWQLITFYLKHAELRSITPNKQHESKDMKSGMHSIPILH